VSELVAPASAAKAAIAAQTIRLSASVLLTKRPPEFVWWVAFCSGKVVDRFVLALVQVVLNDNARELLASLAGRQVVAGPSLPAIAVAAI
jgi:hypothetical protein